jgi:hypothetical protein
MSGCRANRVRLGSGAERFAGVLRASGSQDGGRLGSLTETADKTGVSASLLSFLFGLYAAIAPGGTRVRAQPELMSQQEMEVRVRIEASRTNKVDFEEVTVLETTGQTWPDEGLGCHARKGEAEAEAKPTQGFRIVAKVKTKRLTYHTDRAGRVVTCPASKKKRKAR